MAIIVNGTTIPTAGDNITYGGTKLTKVNVVKDGVTTTVWEKITNLTPPVAQITSYIDIGGNTVDDASTCSGHSGAPKLYNSIWYGHNGDDKEKTWTIKPKAPYTKIKCKLHIHGNNWGNDYGKSWINGSEVSNNSTHEIGPVESFTVKLKVHVGDNGEDDSWQVTRNCCIYDVVLS